MEKRQAEQADGAPGVDEVPPTSTGAVGSTSAPSTGSGSGGSSSGGSSGGGGGGAVKASASSGVGADEPSLKLIPGQVAVIVKHESLPNRLDVEYVVPIDSMKSDFLLYPLDALKFGSGNHRLMAPYG